NSVAVPEIDAAAGGEIGRAVESKEFSARLYDVFTCGVSDRSWRPRRVALAGAGDRSLFATDVARRLATVIGLWARQHRVARVAFLIRRDLGGGDPMDMTQAIAEGLTLAAFDAGRYKTQNYETLAAPTWTIVFSSGQEIASRAQDAAAR